ncbi:MAG: hypothetical protein COB20_02095 [SAR86 cluster bacterium]|uniref:Uncharacterized protein n=1 Tax=SAR86 cluster bacterium TaxID=2030880 RepID=A0A2A4XFB6_9GAMM|nr:MAG: hypothetical protein COB20_02095 [SAR86 cluster bacterium]
MLCKILSKRLPIHQRISSELADGGIKSQNNKAFLNPGCIIISWLSAPNQADGADYVAQPSFLLLKLREKRFTVGG